MQRMEGEYIASKLSKDNAIKQILQQKWRKK